ncbi:hypothetical protein GCM10009558_045170 [Virgisporangium aurantiacum]
MPTQEQPHRLRHIAESFGADAERYDGVVLGGDGAIAGTTDRAAVFDGVSSRVSLPDKLTTQSMSLTAELWFKTTGAGVLISTQNGGPFPAGGTAWSPTGPRQAVSNGTVDDGAWHHAVLSAAVDTQTLYVDGEPQRVTASGLIDHRGQLHVTVGAGHAKDWPATDGDRFHFAGSIDELALYEHGLGPLAVRQHFDAARSIDRLTGITLPQDDRRYATLTYDDGLDRVRSLTDNWNRTWRLDPPTRDQATRTVVMHGPYPDWTYTFDADRGGRIVSQAHDGAVQRYGYNAAGYLSSVVDANGREARFTTDERGNTLSTTTCRTAGSCNTAYATYFHNAADPLDPRNDRVTSRSDARSSGPDDTRYRIGYDYDPAGRPARTTYPVPAGVAAPPTETWRYATGTEAAEGGGTVPAGLLLTATGRRGQTTEHTYTRTGDLAGSVSPTGLRTRYAYDGLGRVREVTTANSGGAVFGSTVTTWTERSQVDSVTEPAVTNPVTGTRHQRVTRYSYDGNGNSTGVTVSDTTPAADGGDPPRTTTFGYDAHDRLARTTYPDGRSETRAYSADGLQVDTTDPAGIVWHDRYDDGRRLLTRTVEGAGVDPLNPAATILALEYRSYDPAGQLATVTDAMGRLTRYTYYDDGLPATVTRENYQAPDGTVRAVPLRRVSYDPAGNPTEVVEAGGRTATYTYDPAGLPLTETLDPSGVNRVTGFLRDADGNPTRIRRTGAAQPDREEITYLGYGPDDQRTREDAVLGAGVQVSTVTTYDERGLPVGVRDRSGQTTTFAYDPTGAVVSATGPAVDVWQGGVRTTGVRPTAVTRRNTFGEPTHERDPNGGVTVNGFDTMGRPETFTPPTYTPPGGAPLTATTRIGYDALGRPERVTDPLGRVTTSTYDPHGNLLTRTLPAVDGAPSTTRFTWTRTGEPLSTTTPGGAQVRSTYDQLGREVTRTQVERVPVLAYYITRIEYEDGGQPVRVISPLGNVTASTYNGLGEQTGVTDATGRTATFGYDIAGRTRSMRDPGGLETVIAYDPLGRPVEIADRKGDTLLRSSTVEYDAGGRPIAETSPQARRTTSGYDAAGRMTSRTATVDASHTITIGLGYDAAGNRTRYVDGNGHATDYTYTAWGLPESTVEPATAAHPGAAERTWTTGYDAAGQAVEELLPGGVRRTRQFDAQGRPTLERGTGAEAGTADRRLGYDPDGRLTTVGGPAGDTTYRFDDRGQLVESTGAGGAATYGYTGEGNLEWRRDAAGTTTFTYDPVGRPASMSDPVTGRTVDYGYTTGGLLGTVTDRSSTRVRRVIGHDDLGRVSSDTVEQRIDSGVPARVLHGTTYGYDLDGHVTTRTQTQQGTSATQAYGYDGAGRLTSWTAPDARVTAYGWDDAGNRTRAGPTTFTYDERDRLLGDGVNRYTYSARGTLGRVGPAGTGPAVGADSRVTRFDAFERLVADGPTEYTYDGLDRQATRGGDAFRYDGQGNSVVSDGRRVISRDVDGAPFADRATGAASGHLLYADEHGDVTGRYLSASVTGTRTFDPFGTPTGSSGETSSLGYQSGWTDPDTGSVNMAARWYSPATGGFLSRDTWTLEPAPTGDGNRYAYGAGDPVGATDPDGHRPCGVRRPCVVKPKGGPRQPMPGGKPAGPQSGGSGSKPGTSNRAGNAGREASRWGWWPWIGPSRDTDVDADSGYARRIGPSASNSFSGEGGGNSFSGVGGGDSLNQGGGAGSRNRFETRPEARPLPGWLPPLVKPVLPPAPADTITPREPAVRILTGSTNVVDPGPQQTIDALNTTVAPADDDEDTATTPVGTLSMLGVLWIVEAGKAGRNWRLSVYDGSSDPEQSVYAGRRSGCLNGTWSGDPIRYMPLERSIAGGPGRATGAEACYQGAIPPTGTKAGSYDPPGFVGSKGIARGHLIGRELGGNGSDPRNLVPLWQNQVNSSSMYHGVEKQVHDKVVSGETVYYRVEPVYDGPNPFPRLLKIVVATNEGTLVFIIENKK